jgi:hypothetical protein
MKLKNGLVLLLLFGADKKGGKWACLGSYTNPIYFSFINAAAKKQYARAIIKIPFRKILLHYFYFILS